MGGGADSRIPRILQESPDLRSADLEVVVRTYSFKPEEGAAQIARWREELQPVLVIGESLGAIQAIRLRGVPHLLISPALGAPRWLGWLAPLSLIPGVPALMGWLYKPREGERQRMSFRFRVVSQYRNHLRLALDNTPRKGSTDAFFAFFGRRDHYRRSGVVSLRMWRKWFGSDYILYDGSHFMEENYIQELLIPKIIELFQNNC